MSQITSYINLNVGCLKEELNGIGPGTPFSSIELNSMLPSCATNYNQLSSENNYGQTVANYMLLDVNCLKSKLRLIPSDAHFTSFDLDNLLPNCTISNTIENFGCQSNSIWPSLSLLLCIALVIYFFMNKQKMPSF